jgi:glycosyltransferase involved in cell wall biosynthesis
MTELYSDVGVNVPHGSTAALTGAIQTLQNDVSLYRRLASRAVEKASRYDWNLIVDRVEAVYREVAARNQPE